MDRLSVALTSAPAASLLFASERQSSSWPTTP
jgi:hypothetical protein